jgi:hypothetical protein
MLDPRGRCFDLTGIGDIRGDGQTFSAELADFAGGNMQTFGIARDEADMRSFARKGTSRGPADARRRAGNNNDSARIRFSHEFT